MKVPVIIPKEEIKCCCGSNDYQVVDWRPLTIICKECCKKLDNKLFKIEYVED